MGIIAEYFPHEKSNVTSFIFSYEELNKFDSLIRGGYFESVKALYDFLVREIHYTKLNSQYRPNGVRAEIRTKFMENLVGIGVTQIPFLETLFKKVMLELRFFALSDTRKVFSGEDKTNKDTTLIVVFYLLLKEIDVSFLLFEMAYLEEKRPQGAGENGV